MEKQFVMIFKNIPNKTPEWVKDLADGDPTKVLLTRILEHTKQPLENPKKILFAIRLFEDEQSAYSAANEYLKKEGWASRVDYDDIGKKYVLEAEKEDYILTKDHLDHDEALFQRVANLYRASYDGWTVIIPPK